MSETTVYFLDDNFRFVLLCFPLDGARTSEACYALVTVGVAVVTPINTFPRTVIVFVISAFHLDKLQCARAHAALSTVSVDAVIVMQIGFFLR